MGVNVVPGDNKIAEAPDQFALRVKIFSIFLSDHKFSHPVIYDPPWGLTDVITCLHSTWHSSDKT